MLVFQAAVDHIICAGSEEKVGDGQQDLISLVLTEEGIDQLEVSDIAAEENVVRIRIFIQKTAAVGIEGAAVEDTG